MVNDMAYLDEDILYNNVEEKYKSAKGETRAAYSDVLDTICEMPRADVVPKSEVERLQIELDSMRGAANSYKMHYENLAREIFEEIESKKIFLADKTGKIGVVVKIKDIEDLKKKYTEELK